ncbi:MAG: SGNH/GDSL hydrolase family protein [Candidatus Omnitrophica bacterium]|nr:SGNH/GDSL hydrolase family protein [Candidatus Omnitrophota bacterium]
MKFAIKEGQKVVCIGDSITDCGRRAEFAPLGNGYVKYFNDMIIARYPERKIAVVNKGISGNTIIDLQNRWEDDVIYHKPDWLTILIGINDLHHVLRKDPDWQKCAAEKFEQGYIEILSKTKEKLNCGIVLLEPFYISVDNSNSWRKMVLEELKTYTEVVRKMAKKFNTGIIKLQEIFQKQLRYNDSETFCPEPVHPNTTGHIIIASHLFDAFLS